MNQRKIKIVDTILRDAQQSQLATRMSTEQMLPILKQLDDTGYEALEVWGGASFDACLRYLNEDPWERLRMIRKHVKKTKLQMLLRGQNLLGYKHYPDDVVDLFIQKSIENGIDIIRVFDALNDIRNLKQSVESIKKHGGHAQLAICYTISEVHTDEYYVDLVKAMLKMGADSIAIKDMSGILMPQRAYDLVFKIKEICTVPLHIHTHSSSGIAEMTYLKAIEAGADCIDTAVSVFAGGTSQPSTESMVMCLREMGYQLDVKLDKLVSVAEHLRTLKQIYIKEGIFDSKVLETDPNTLTYQVPGGMISNLIAQLKAAKQDDKFHDVLKEVPLVRSELGYPPLVTPLSQMVGTQAVMNILNKERYKMVPNEIKDYVKGYYGKSPAPMKTDIVDLIAKGDKDFIDVRPADLIEPALELYRKELKEYEVSDEDLLSYALFPTLALPMIRKKHDPFYDVPVQEVTILY